MYKTIEHTDSKTMQSDLVDHIRRGWTIRYYAFTQGIQYLAVLKFGPENPVR